MITEELRRIQAELKKPFPAHQHEFRKLPGSDRKWVFLPWQAVRERLDEVCPTWTNDHSEIQLVNNDVVCRAAITILGIRKEAIASVPVSLLSKEGNEMTRGTPADRLAAEALKNAAEQWGVGRYLDDQKFTIHYLWERMRELDEERQGEIRKLSQQYRIDKGTHVFPASSKESGFIHAVAGIPAGIVISEKQRKRLWAIGKTELKLNDEQIKQAQKHFGFEHTEQITQDKYDAVIDKMRLVSLHVEGQPWSSWKNPDDAIAWAQSQLPTYSPSFLEQEFASLTSTNGKKAPAWVQRVQELKQEF